MTKDGLQNVQYWRTKAVEQKNPPSACRKSFVLQCACTSQESCCQPLHWISQISWQGILYLQKLSVGCEGHLDRWTCPVEKTSSTSKLTGRAWACFPVPLRGPQARAVCTLETVCGAMWLGVISYDEFTNTGFFSGVSLIFGKTVFCTLIFSQLVTFNNILLLGPYNKTYLTLN